MSRLLVVRDVLGRSCVDTPYIDKIDRAAQRNGLPWHYAHREEMDELRHRFKLKLPERVPFFDD